MAQTAHSADAASLAALTLIIHLVKILTVKGLLSDEDYRAMLSNAVADVSRNKDGDAAIAIIREIVGAPPA